MLLRAYWITDYIAVLGFSYNRTVSIVGLLALEKVAFRNLKKWGLFCMFVLT